MAKKYFYNKVYNTRKTIINFTIIGVCIIGIIICFIVVTKFQNNNANNKKGNINYKEVVTVEINEEFNKDIFFSKIENVNLNDVDIQYPADYDISKPGSYKVTILVNNEKYDSTLMVVDTQKPQLKLQEVTIEQNKGYSPKDFVVECSDNSKEECIIDFYNGAIDEEGEEINYSNYSKVGIYSIKISAKDSSGNQEIQETKLTIKKTSTSVVEPETITCKYGNNVYDTKSYLLAFDVTSNKCAISLDKYKDPEILKTVINTEQKRIQKDVEALNINKIIKDLNLTTPVMFAINQSFLAIPNISGDGIVGFEVTMIIRITDNNGKTYPLTEYKLNSAGKRVFISNPYNLPE